MEQLETRGFDIDSENLDNVRDRDTVHLDLTYTKSHELLCLHYHCIPEIPVGFLSYNYLSYQQINRR